VIVLRGVGLSDLPNDGSTRFIYVEALLDLSEASDVDVGRVVLAEVVIEVVELVELENPHFVLLVV
jgi:hypothetical protein